MALLDEQIVEEWLNSNNFFTIRGVKYGNNNEIDLLACRNQPNQSEYWHVEVQISYSPVAYVSNSNAKARDLVQIKDDVNSWIEKKFTSEKVATKRNSIVPDVNWKFVFVHGVVKDSRELAVIRNHGIELVSYKDVVNQLINNQTHKSSSTALGVIDIVKHFRNT